MSYNLGSVWFAKFPEEDNEGNLTGKWLPRPVIVLSEDKENLEVLSVKVTKSEVRSSDKYDTPILQWEEAKLRFKSTARISKTMYIPMSVFEFKIGELHPDDLKTVTDLYMKLIQERKEKGE